MTDRSTYIAYLESQLDRITASCMTVQSFDERLKAAHSGVCHLEGKLLNVAQLVRSHQAYAEEAESVQRKTLEQVQQRVQLSHDLLFGDHAVRSPLTNAAVSPDKHSC